MPIPTPQRCNWCGCGFTGSDCLGKPCQDCRDKYQIKCRGVGRDGENPNAIFVAFDRPPTGGELRQMHSYFEMVGMMIETPDRYEIESMEGSDG